MLQIFLHVTIFVCCILLKLLHRHKSISKVITCKTFLPTSSSHVLSCVSSVGVDIHVDTDTPQLSSAQYRCRVHPSPQYHVFVFTCVIKECFTVPKQKLCTFYDFIKRVGEIVSRERTKIMIKNHFQGTAVKTVL